MKHKVFVIVSFVLLPVIFLVGGIYYGYDSGFSAGNTTGFELGKVISYERGYVSGYDNGREYVVTHLDQYVTVPKAVSYDEVVEFLKEDKTSDEEYTDDFDCMAFARILRENSNNKNIRCGIVVFDLSGTKDISHAINCFETTDKGIVYFDPQTDGQRYGIYVGGYYNLSERYRITQVDIIW